MIQDKLEHDERLRLECLAQAIAGMRGLESPEQIIQRAGDFEKYVRDGRS